MEAIDGAGEGVKRVVVTGSECTGKTTLSRALARHYRTVWVPEFVRQFVERKQAPPGEGDVEVIARGQIALEEKLAFLADRLLIQDTDLLSTVLYSHHYYQNCPRWIGETLGRRAADLYLLAGIDVSWVANGNQRDRGHRREEMQALFRDALTRRGLRFVEIHGSQAERQRRAVAVIDELLDLPP